MLSFLLILVAVNGGACVDWCELSCKREDATYKHTVCERGESCPPEPGCEDADIFTDEMKKFLLDETNRYRNMIALGEEPRVPEEWKGASDMMALSWDNQLEYVVRCHIRRCKFEHDKCRITPKYSSGQNLAITVFKPKGNCTHKTITRLMAGWYNEVANMKPEYYGSFQDVGSLAMDKMIGHFTQLVWAKTEYVGCAITTKVSEGETMCLLGCNYGPTGNYLEDPVYTKGAPCSQCPNGLKCNSVYGGLCGEITEPTSGSFSISISDSFVLCLGMIVSIHYLIN
ncbi:venom allergen 5 2-like [Cylas formicarius]|uniref:venom allergen 5 2-like n=1 Tax=Cylas formicarius TaxID=197179 RepID=UPI002958BC02|nr:venom allergen 5 2-like [Cylas formicarius]